MKPTEQTERKEDLEDKGFIIGMVILLIIALILAR